MSNSKNTTEKLFNIIATNVKTGEKVIEKYDFTAMDAQTWIHNNAASQPSWTFTIEPVEEKESTIVYFHTGKGGRFNNSGFKSFRGTKNIIEVLQLADNSGQWNSINFENADQIRKDLAKRNLTNLLSLFEKCQDADDFTDFTAKTDLDLGEKYYTDSNGSLLISVAEAEKGIGRIDWDGDYDTDTCMYLNDCDENELILIANSNEWNTESLLQEYFDTETDLKIDWSKFNKNYTGLIEEYFSFPSLNVEDYYEIEETYKIINQ